VQTPPAVSGLDITDFYEITNSGAGVVDLNLARGCQAVSSTEEHILCQPFFVTSFRKEKSKELRVAKNGPEYIRFWAQGQNFSLPGKQNGQDGGMNSFARRLAVTSVFCEIVCWDKSAI